MVRLAQLVRASDCGSEGRGFETHISPLKIKDSSFEESFIFYLIGLARLRECLDLTRIIIKNL